MAKPTRYTIMKLLAFDPELWEKVTGYRWDNKLPSDAQAVRDLLRKALKLPPEKPEK